MVTYPFGAGVRSVALASLPAGGNARSTKKYACTEAGATKAAFVAANSTPELCNRPLRFDLSHHKQSSYFSRMPLGRKFTFWGLRTSVYRKFSRKLSDSCQGFRAIIPLEFRFDEYRHVLMCCSLVKRCVQISFSLYQKADSSAEKLR